MGRRVQVREHARRAQRVLLIFDDQFEGKTVPGQRRWPACPRLDERLIRETLSDRITGRHRQRRQGGDCRQAEVTGVGALGQPLRPMARVGQRTTGILAARQFLRQASDAE